jgi:hypothetical protein
MQSVSLPGEMNIRNLHENSSRESVRTIRVLPQHKCDLFVIKDGMGQPMMEVEQSVDN